MTVTINDDYTQRQGQQQHQQASKVLNADQMMTKKKKIVNNEA